MTAPRPRAAAPPLAGPGGPSTAEQMPPLVLPGEHFAAGLVWLVAGAAALPLIAGSLAAGAFLTPRAIAVTHCFTLGWVTTSIFGALYQLFPVALGIPARSVRVGHVTFWVLQAGVIAMVAGSWTWRPALLAAGWVLLFAAVGGLSWNLLPQRRRAPRGRVVGLYVSAAHAALGLAMVLAAARIGEALGWWTVPRLGFLSAHAHLAALGFATLTVVGVGSRLFPMFLLSRGHPEWPLTWIGPLVLAGLVPHAIGAMSGQALLTTAGGLLVASGVALYLFQAGTYYARRTRRALDPGLAHAAAALGFLGVALVLGLVLLTRSVPDGRLMAAYGVAGVLGWLTLVVVGMYYKIVPFLTWLHRFSPRVGEAGLPRVADLTVPRLAWTTLVLLASGVTVLIAGIAAGTAAAARTGAGLVTGGALLVAAQYARIAWLALKDGSHGSTR
jgi:hypothetical protein